MIFIARGHTNGRTKATAANMGLWQVGADGINFNFGNSIWHQFRRAETY
jgi:hypothetical protein